MEVFKHAISHNGGQPLPLNQYLLPTVEPPGGIASNALPALSPSHTRINRVSFFEAVLHDKYFATVVAFLLGGMSPDVRREEDGATALHVAVSGRADATTPASEETGPVKHLFDPPCPNSLIISFLVDNGADVDAENARGETPLMVAVASQNMRAVKLLLAKGADLQRRDHNGHSVLRFAAPHPHVIQALQVWIGSDELPRMAREEFLLHTVCSRTGMVFSALFLIEQLELDVNAARPIANRSAAPASDSKTTAVGVSHAEGEGETPLHCAVRAGDVALVKALLSKGADPLKSDVSVDGGGAGGTTPLQLADSLSARGSRKKASKQPLVDRAGVCKLLRAYVSARPESQARTKLLGEASVQLWHVNNLNDWVRCVMVGAAPHVVLALACHITDSFTLLVGVLVGLLFVMFQVRVTDENRASVPIVPSEAAKWKPQSVAVNAIPRRPLRTFGLFAGCMLAFVWSLSVESRAYTASPVANAQAQAQRDATAVNAQARAHWLAAVVMVPLAVVTIVCLATVIVRSPGTVTSTPGQRKGIYASILRAKGVPSKELLYSTDLTTMVKKPLRAQHCPFIERVVLRYDHFSLHLASPIGARNYRAFVYGHVGLCAWLLVMAMVSSALTESLFARSNAAEEVLLGTPSLRLVYVYTRVLLPLFILISGFIVFEHVLVIRRNISSFDISHVTDDSSLYCFELGNAVYSLFDQGPSTNVKRFFLGQEVLDEITYRIPQMSAYLTGLVREHERWQLTTDSHDACCQGNDHGHSHGTANGDGGTHTAASEDALESQLTFLTGSRDAAAAAAAKHGSVDPSSAAEGDGRGDAVVPAETATSLAYGLFQELIKHGGDPELFRTSQRAARTDIASNIGASLSPEEVKRQQEWDEAVAEAREMYRVFQENMNAQMMRFLHEHGADDQSEDPAGQPVAPAVGSGQPPTQRHAVHVPVVEDTFVSASKRE